VPAKTCLVITSIAEPTPALRSLAAASQRSDFDFILIGDEASPARFELDGCDYYGLERQRRLPLEFAQICPVRQYARKNIGYLLAMQRGAPIIVETDDDTVAYDRFWQARERSQAVGRLAGQGWMNVYRYFSNANIWPRGLPLDQARTPVPAYESLPLEEVLCPIQQGLVDDDPDVDAVYRLLLELPFRFESGPSIALTDGTWCPFNSQNTAWWPEAFPLMYLPVFCSFRMTDIWRSFVAQKLAWANDWGVLYHEPTVSQNRNAHDLMRDFRDEIPGYLENRAICAALADLSLQPGTEHLSGNMRLAYERLVEGGWLDGKELVLLDAWLTDVRTVSCVTDTVRAAGEATVATDGEIQSPAHRRLR
jgi:STELLO glycosyltransferase-like protein